MGGAGESDDAVRARLLAERQRVAAQAADVAEEHEAILASAQDTALDDEHDPDGATVGFERARVSALADLARRRLTALDDALARLEAGTYGRCEHCAAAIHPERLTALPETTTCTACAATSR